MRIFIKLEPWLGGKREQLFSIRWKRLLPLEYFSARSKELGEEMAIGMLSVLPLMGPAWGTLFGIPWKVTLTANIYILAAIWHI